MLFPSISEHSGGRALGGVGDGGGRRVRGGVLGEGVVVGICEGRVCGGVVGGVCVCGGVLVVG